MWFFFIGFCSTLVLHNQKRGNLKKATIAHSQSPTLRISTVFLKNWIIQKGGIVLERSKVVYLAVFFCPAFGQRMKIVYLSVKGYR